MESYEFCATRAYVYICIHLYAIRALFFSPRGLAREFVSLQPWCVGGNVRPRNSNLVMRRHVRAIVTGSTSEPDDTRMFTQRVIKPWRETNDSAISVLMCRQEGYRYESAKRDLRMRGWAPSRSPHERKKCKRKSEPTFSAPFLFVFFPSVWSRSMCDFALSPSTPFLLLFARLAGDFILSWLHRLRLRLIIVTISTISHG